MRKGDEMNEIKIEEIMVERGIIKKKEIEEWGIEKERRDKIEKEKGKRRFFGLFIEVWSKMVYDINKEVEKIMKLGERMEGRENDMIWKDLGMLKKF